MAIILSEIETAEGFKVTNAVVTRKLADHYNENGTLNINLSYYKDLESTPSYNEGKVGKMSLRLVPPYDIYQFIMRPTLEDVARINLAVNEFMLKFFENLYGFWNVSDNEFGLYNTVILTPSSNSITLPDGYKFTGIKVDGVDFEITNEHLFMIVIPEGETKSVTYKATL